MRGWLAAIFSLFTVSVSAAPDCAMPRACVEQGWHVAVAMGLGERSNPLDGGDRIPLLLLPDITWYGERAYFDNGELGAQWQTAPHTAIDLFLSVNGERAYFSFWHPNNIFLTRMFMTSNTTQEDGMINERLMLSTEHIEKRRWAVDAGVRWHIYLNDAEWQFAALTDASDVHNGQQFAVRYLQQWTFDDAALQAYVGATWKSAALIDYYYGIDADDQVVPELYYQGRAGWQPEVGLSFNKTIDEKWSWLVRASVIALHDGMTDSAIVDETYISTVFAGITYQF